ncbi:unnamed protein product [Blepharisma stoltei]|uniref:Uncharacterized protein n=1 Tax=Blepharisma stoltei TaxID=1481888 RepID=A0AAU9J0B1_9CILI|nr:unnamed protein product [Blepharisma stoltei]
MEIEQNIYRWLNDSGFLPHRSQGTYSYEINEIELYSLQSGIGFMKLLQLIWERREFDAEIHDIKSLKKETTMNSRLYNWNILIGVLELIDISIDSDTKALLVAGDKGKIRDLLRCLYDIYLGNNPNKNTKLTIDGALILDKIDINLDFKETETCLEFLIVSLCKCLQIIPKQAAGLLAQKGKLLSQIIIKGIKGKHEPVTMWYLILKENNEHLMRLVEKEQENGALNLVLTNIKHGLYSKDYGTYEKCVELLILLKKEWTQYRIVDWFSGSEIIDAAIRPYIFFFENYSAEKSVNLLFEFDRKNLYEAFGENLKNSCKNIKLFYEVVLSFIPYISSNEKLSQQFHNKDIYSYWINQGINEAEKNPMQWSCIIFLCELWGYLSNPFEINEKTANLILNAIKYGIREKQLIIKFSSFTQLFKLLSIFSKVKNSFAPIVYKTLTFALVENYMNQDLKEFIFINFALLFEEDQTIPLCILLDPLIKQLQHTDGFYNISDFEFFISLSKHPGLELDQGLALTEFLGKVYYNDIVYAKASSIPFLLLAGRFIKNTKMEKYLIKFVKLGLKLVCDRYKKRYKDRDNIDTNYVITRNIAFSMIEKIISIRHITLNNKIKQLLTTANSNLKYASGKNIKGIMAVLALIGGDPSESISTCEVVQTPPTRKSEFSSENAEKLSSSTIPGRKRAIKYLEKLKSKLSERELIEKNNKELQTIEEKKMIKNINDEIEKRRILLGVESRKNADNPIIFDQLPIFDEINLIDIENETESEKELLKIVIQKYKRVANFLFQRYSGHKNNSAPKNTFESFRDAKSVITEAEIRKLLREQGITKEMISNSEIKKIYTQMIVKLKIPVLSYSEFFNFLIQISAAIYSKKQRNLLEFPLAVSYKALFEHFSKYAENNGIPKSYYEDPDYGIGDPEVAKGLNEKLKRDPEYPMPEGYKRSKQESMEVSYFIPKHLEILEKQKIAIEILDEIFYKSFKFHFLEHKISLKTSYHAKGFVSKADDSYWDYSKDSRNIYMPFKFPADLKLPSEIKLEAAKLGSIYPNEIILECAKLVDDLLFSVENKSFTLISRIKKPGLIINRFLEQKLNAEILAKAEEERNEIKRKLRQAELGESLKELKLRKEEKTKEEEAIKKLEQEKEALKKQKNTDLYVKYNIDNDIKLKASKITQDKKEQEIADKSKKTYMKLDKSFTPEKSRKDFSIKNRRAKSSLNEAMIREITHDSPIKNTNIGTSSNSSRRNKEIKVYIEAAIAEKKVIETFNEFSASIKTLHEFFSAKREAGIDFTNFQKFIAVFNIFPYLLPDEDAIRTFRALTWNKSGFLRLNINEFKEALLRIALLSMSPLEKELKTQFKSYGDILKGLFDFMCIPKDAIQAYDFLEKLSSQKRTQSSKSMMRFRKTLAAAVSLKFC